MERVVTVARNTFREAIRDRVLYSLVLFAILMILSSLVLGTLSAEQYNKIIKDLGLTAISLFGIMISIFLGMGLVNKEIEKHTVFNIFSKPINRSEFIAGKYLGLSFTLLVITAAMAAILSAIVIYIELANQSFLLFYYGGHYFTEFFTAIYFQYLEFLVIIGIALVFSSFTTPVLAVLMTFLLFAAGRFSSDIKLLADNTESPVVGIITEVIYRVIPNLEKFDLRTEAVYGGSITPVLVLYTSAYTLLYVLALLVLSIAIFNRKEFK